MIVEGHATEVMPEHEVEWTQFSAQGNTSEKSKADDNSERSNN